MVSLYVTVKDVSDNSQTEASLRPVLLLLVGASGAGKTTFYETHLKTVFPKVLKTSASPLEKAESDRQWKCLLKERQSFVYVSDLFDLEVIRDVRAAGYETKAVYLATEDPKLNLGRVLIRINNGGRFAPISRIANDHTQGLRQLPRVRKLTDDLMLFDNTAHGRDVRLVAHFKVGKLVKLAREIPKWAQKGLRTEFDKWVQLVRERNQDEEAASMAVVAVSAGFPAEQRGQAGEGPLWGAPLG